MLRNLFSLIIAAFLMQPTANAQDWVKKMQDPSVNFYDVQSSFNHFWKKEERRAKLKSFFRGGRKTEEENEGFIMYKRWENYVLPRVYPSGDRSVMEAGNEEIMRSLTSPSYKSSRLAAGNWQPLGSFAVPTNGGAGRLNCVAFHPTDPNTIYVGAPAGGLWKSTDNGLSWTTNTDHLPTLGVNDIAIDPTNPNIMYIGTGDIDAGDTYGVGVLKSTDGGASWNITGLNWITSQGRSVSRVIINPDDPNMIFASCSNGVFRSKDAGITWVRTLSATNIKDMELKPGDPSIVYAASTSGFYRSINGGTSFLSVTGALPSGVAVNRIGIAVSPANPSIVYLLYSASSNSGFYGLYCSTNSGSTFTFRSNYPNVLGYDTDGDDTGGNGWYTLSIAASPVDADELIVGGVNVYKSNDGGYGWTIVSHWYGGAGLPYVHADIHNLAYRPDGSEFYAACDGGLFKTTNGGSSWQDKSDGLQICEMYRLGNAATDASMIIQGWQDNGSNIYYAGAWGQVLGGDGMECFVDWSTTNYVYAEYQNGSLHRSSDGGGSFHSILTDITEDGEWITPWCQDPLNPATIYAGFKNVWKSTNRGDNWTQISTFNSSGLTSLVVAKSDPQYIYASQGYDIYKTTNGGATWTTLSPPGSSYITYIAVSETDPEKIWITRSGYAAGNKVYKSTDGAVTWTNISGSLPNIPANCITSQTGTNDGVYVGTDVGIYYIDNTLSSWMPYSNGLPNVVVDELEIHYGSGKLRAATYGRGLWETGIYDPLSPLPFANFAGDTLSGCPGFTVQFSDSSTNAPTSWSWTCPGGTPSTSTVQNPVVTYLSPGHYYDVTLVVSNASGTDSLTKHSYIAVSPQVTPIISLNKNDSICSGQAVYLSASSGSSYHWHPFDQVGPGISVNATGTFSVSVTDEFNCEVTSAPVDIHVLPVPAVPTISYSGVTLTSSPADGYQWFLNGNPIPGATGSSYVTDGMGGNYTVAVTDSTGICSTVSAIFVGVSESGPAGVTYNVFPNPGEGQIQLVLQTTSNEPSSVKITDVLGKTVYQTVFDGGNNREEVSIDIRSSGSGLYFLTISNSKGSVSQKLIVR